MPDELQARPFSALNLGHIFRGLLLSVLVGWFSLHWVLPLCPSELVFPVGRSGLCGCTEEGGRFPSPAVGSLPASVPDKETMWWARGLAFLMKVEFFGQDRVGCKVEMMAPTGGCLLRRNPQTEGTGHLSQKKIFLGSGSSYLLIATFLGGLLVQNRKNIIYYMVPSQFSGSIFSGFSLYRKDSSAQSLT